MIKNGAVFLDRDGTINEEVGYLDSLEKLKLYPKTFAALNLINDNELKAIVVTNQSGVARGLFKEHFVSLLHGRIQEMLRNCSAHIDAFYYCPHHPTEGYPPYRKYCLCRKPGAGMFHLASKDMNIDLRKSYMIGDTLKDMEAARNAGMKGILVKTGYGSSARKELGNTTEGPISIAEDILDAVNLILRDRIV